MKKQFLNIIALAAFALASTVHGAASSSGSGATSSTAVSRSDRKHAQLIMLIDNTEKPSDDSSQAVTESFVSVMNSLNVPFIVSKSVVYNYLARLKRNDPVKDAGIASDDPVKNKILISSILGKWQAYLINDTSYILCVPKGYDFSDPKNGLKVPDLKAVAPLDIDFLSEKFLQFLEIWPTVPFAPDQLHTIFKTKKEETESSPLPIWDIVIHGHGNMGADIGGLPAKTMQDLLMFFNNNLHMGALYIESCSAGGKNRDLLQFDQAIGNKNLLNLHYTVFVGSVSDCLTWRDANTHLKWQRFFEMTQEEKPLGELISMLGSMQLKDKDPFASSNIPQVWIPGGYGFQTYQVDKRIKVLSKVLVAAHEDEERPIVIPETTEVVLVYPKKVSVPTQVMLHTTKDVESKGELLLEEKAWKSFPTAFRLLVDTARFKRYPRFISMLRGKKSINYFERIELWPFGLNDTSVLGNLGIYGGVMQFIRDAFIPSSTAKVSVLKRFFIGELSGPNDLSLLLELSREKTGVHASGLEAAASAYIGKKITLQNVTILARSDELKLAFTFAGKGWLAKFKQDPQNLSEIAWRFSEKTGSGVWPLVEIEEEIESPYISQILRRSSNASSASSSHGEPECDQAAIIEYAKELLDEGSAHLLDSKRSFVRYLQTKRFIHRCVFNDDVSSEIARLYYLKFKGKRKLPIWLAEKFKGISIQDLNKHNMVPQGTMLNLSGKYISDLTGLQDIPDKQEVTHLALDDNLLQSIDTRSFNGFYALEYLTISSNPLNSINSAAFIGLEHLRTLKLNNNQLIKLDQDAFIGLKELRNLDLSYNRLQDIPLNVFVHLKELEGINLSHNHISNLTPQLFLDINDLVILNLEGNFINKSEQIRIEAEILTQFPKARVLFESESESKEGGVSGEEDKVE